ncbi:MAG: hypothetical protein ABR907_05440 [Terracidiphilus sp.]|jgi:hypothetical protein
MFNRLCLGAFLLAGLALTIVGCGTSPSLTSIVVSPSSMSFGGAGLTTQLTAIGYYTHPGHPAETKNITNSVSWTSSTPQCVTVNSTGFITSGFNVCSNIPVTASAPGFNGIIQGSMIVNVTQPTQLNTDITKVSVIPATQTVASLNIPVQFEALGTTGSGDSVALTGLSGLTWISSEPTVAFINNSGLATTAGSGTTTITATFVNSDGTAAQGSGTLTVSPTGSPEPLTAMTVAPNAQTALAIGQTAQFLAIATTGSGTSVNLTNQTATVNGQTIKAAVWTSSNPSVASIDPNTGIAKSIAAGAAVMTAVASNPDGSVVTGASTYTVTVSTTSGSEPLTGLAIVPPTATALAINQQVHFLALGTTSGGGSVNLTNQTVTVGSNTVGPAVWTSSNPSIATIDPATGIATTLSAGTTAIVAVASNPDKTVVTATAVLTVTVPASTEPLVGLAIIPASQTLTTVGETANLIVLGITGSGATVNLTAQSATVNGATIAAATWSSTVLSVATIDPNSGIAKAVGNGVTAITAQAINTDKTVVSATIPLTVALSTIPEPLLSLAIIPSTPSVASPLQTTQLTAIGTFSAAPVTQNLTNGTKAYPITWTSSNTGVATVGSPEKAGTTPGLVSGVGQGTTTIVATVPNTDGSVVVGTATFSVTGGTTEPMTAINIYPGTLTLGATGQTGQFIAIGTSGLTGLNVDVTNSASLKWTSSIPTIAQICPIIPAPTPNPCTSTSNGLAIGKSPGLTNIAATWTNPDNSVVTGQASVTVQVTPQPEPLLSINVVPTSIITGNTQLSGQFLAFGTFSTDPTLMDITNGFTHAGFVGEVPVTWTSSEPDIFPVSQTGGPGAPAGVATSLGTGTAAITVEATNTDGTVVSGAATFGCKTVNSNTNGLCVVAATSLSTLTVMNAGQNQTNWLVTAPSATDTPDVIHCGGSVEQATTQGSVCYSNYPTGVYVTVTEPAGAGKFGGWSSNCIPCNLTHVAGQIDCPAANTPVPDPYVPLVGTPAPLTAAGPNSCAVPMVTTDIVAAIVN